MKLHLSIAPYHKRTKVFEAFISHNNSAHTTAENQQYTCTNTGVDMELQYSTRQGAAQYATQNNHVYCTLVD